MADALGADGECFPDGFRAGGFAGVISEAQASGFGAGEKVAEGFGAGAALISAEANGDDGGVVRAHFDGFAEDAVGLFDGEMADGIEDPVERQAEFGCGAFAGMFECGEDWLEAARIEVAPHIDDADGDVDLSVDNALLGELLHHAPGGEFVIFGVAEAAGDGLEGFDEFGEVGEPVERFGLSQGQAAGVVAGA